jgi:putative ABC transport system ATP-binding protein
MSEVVIRTRGLEKIVPTAEGQLVILDGIDLEINAGETVAIVGASGSGKTTLLGILAGLDLPSGGTVSLVGQELTASDEEQRARIRGEQVGFVFQSFQLLGSLTALENVMLPGELRGDRGAEQEAREFLGKVGLAARTHHYPRQLSGGEQQRVAIARAFAARPNVLFADEPTGNLDTTTGQRIIDLLFDLNAEAATTLILVTHDERVAARCQRVIEIAARPVGRMSPRLIARLAWRDWRSGELGLLLVALMVAITSVTAVALLVDRLQRALLSESADFLAADRYIGGSQPIPDAFRTAAAARGLDFVDTLSFPSMVFAGEERNQLVSIKAVGLGYPLRGRLIAADEPFGAGQPAPSMCRRSAKSGWIPGCSPRSGSQWATRSRSAWRGCGSGGCWSPNPTAAAACSTSDRGC